MHASSALRPAEDAHSWPAVMSSQPEHTTEAGLCSTLRRAQRAASCCREHARLEAVEPSALRPAHRCAPPAIGLTSELGALRTDFAGGAQLANQPAVAVHALLLLPGVPPAPGMPEWCCTLRGSNIRPPVAGPPCKNWQRACPATSRRNPETQLKLKSAGGAHLATWWCPLGSPASTSWRLKRCAFQALKNQLPS